MIKSFYRNLKNNLKYVIGSGEKWQRENNEVTIFILDEPSHGNIGDQAIAYAESSFVKKNFPTIAIVEFTEDKILSNLKNLKKTIRDEDIIILHGGGNLGTLYIQYEEIRRFIIKKFPNNKIIVFPQSIFFEDSKIGNKELNISRHIYNNHEHLSIIAREPKSFELMKKFFEDTNIYMTPDIVLSLEIPEKKTERKGIITLLRDDKEKLNMGEVDSIILELANIYDVTESDTHLREKFNTQIDYTNRRNVLESKWSEISQHEVVITDRLHGMIFSVITRTPCIVFPNNNHKILETYKKYLSKSSSIVFIENAELDKVIKIINEIRNRPFDEIEGMDDKFKILKQIIAE